jgi:hypothetical protein
VNSWKNFKNSQGAHAPGSALRRGMFTLKSRDFEDVVFNDFIKDDLFQKVMVKSSQVLHPFLDPVVLGTEEQTLTRKRAE